MPKLNWVTMDSLRRIFMYLNDYYAILNNSTQQQGGYDWQSITQSEAYILGAMTIEEREARI